MKVKNNLETKVSDFELPEILDFAEPFPIECFSEHFKDLCIHLSKVYNLPIKVPAITLFFTIGGAVGATRKIIIKKGWDVYPNFVCADIGVSGIGKDHLLNKIKDIISNKEEKVLKPLNEKALKERKLYEIKLKKLNKVKNPDDITLNKIPIKPKRVKILRYYVNDITMEALAVVLKDNPRGVIIFNNELSGMLTGFGRYLKSGMAEVERSFYIACIDGSSYSINRITRESFNLKNPLISIYASIQPEIFKKTFSQFDIQRGFFQRWNFLFISKNELDIEHEKKDFELDDNAELFLKSFVDFLYMFDFQPNEKESKPIKIYLSDEAKHLNKEFLYNMDVKAHNAIIEGLFGYYRKNKPLGVKIAFYLSVMDLFLKYFSSKNKKGEYHPNNFNIIISKETLIKAIKIANWLINQTKKVWLFFLEGHKPYVEKIEVSIAKAIVQIFNETKESKIFTFEIAKKLKNEYDDITTKSVGRYLNKINLNPSILNKNGKRKRGITVNDKIINELKKFITKSTYLSHLEK